MKKHLSAHLRLPLIFLALYVAAAALLFAFQKSFIYVPAVGAEPPSAFGMDGVMVTHLQTADGEELEVWSSAATPGRPTIAFFHGNAGNLSDRAPTLGMFKAKGYGFVAMDYRGYGNSTGTPSEQALYDDGRLVLDTIINVMQIPASSVILYGESLGTGIATTLAAELGVAGLVLQSPYTSVAEAAKRQFFWLPVDLLLTERFSNIDKIARVHEPVLILHGLEDSLFPVSMAKDIEAMATTKVSSAYFANVGHNDLSVVDIGLHLDNFVALLAHEPPIR
ncbi:Alpha/beta hydrolase family protein [compost metagenome]